MADRYWVGASGNWNDTAKWSATNGGAGGASVPTTSDNAIITQGASALTISINIATVTLTNLTLTGNNATTFRLLFASSVIGTARTFAVSGTVTVINTDFRDITFANAINLSAITGGSGDCGGNSGITFTTAQPQYFKKYASTANYGDAANWFTDLALTVAGRVPLPQDLGSKFLAGSFNQTCTVSCNVPRIPCLDMSEVVNTVTWSLANAVEVYGSYVLGNNITQRGNNQLNLNGRGEYSFNSCGKPFYSLIINAYNGTYTNQSDINQAKTTFIYLNYGTFDINDFNITGGQFGNTVGTSTLKMGNGIITLKYEGPIIFYLPNTNVICENSTLILSPDNGSTNITCRLSNKIYNKIIVSGNHTGFIDILQSNTIAELIIDSGRKVRFTAGTTQTIAKATIGANVTLDCITASTYTLALADITTAENANIKGCIAPVSKLFAEANSVDSGSNTNVVFGDYFTPQEILIENRIN